MVAGIAIEDSEEIPAPAGLFPATQVSGTEGAPDWSPVKQPASLSTSEIDVEWVIQQFRKPAPFLGGPIADFAKECTVTEISAVDRSAVLAEKCPVCQSSWVEPRFQIGGTTLQIVDCCGCGTGRLNPLPDSLTIAQFYPPTYYGAAGRKFVPLVEGLVRAVGSLRLRRLSAGLARGAKILDVGCGRGVVLSELAERGFDVHGFEISAEAAAGIDPRAKLQIADCLQHAAYPDAYFDQVILWHVLEHLPQPRETLAEIRRILKPGGRLIVAVPNYSSFQARWAKGAWFHLDPPRHLFHFPVEGLRKLLDDAGFARRSEHHFSLRQNPFGWVQSALNRTSLLPRNALYSLLKRGGPPPGMGVLTRTAVRCAYWLGMPAACLVCLAESVLQSGASVCIVSEARP